MGDPTEAGVGHRCPGMSRCGCFIRAISVIERPRLSGASWSSWSSGRTRSPDPLPGHSTWSASLMRTTGPGWTMSRRSRSGESRPVPAEDMHLREGPAGGRRFEDYLTGCVMRDMLQSGSGSGGESPLRGSLGRRVRRERNPVSFCIDLLCAVNEIYLRGKR